MKNIITFSALIFCTGALFSQSLSEGLLLYYPCNGDATDLSGNAFHGVSTATATEDTDGNTNAALNFDGIDQYVIIPSDAILKPELPVTISFWANFDGVADPSVNWGVFSNDDTEDMYTGIFISYNNDRTLSINVCDGGGIGPDSRRTLVTNGVQDSIDWHHYVFVINTLTDMKIYADCIEQAATYTGNGGSLQYSSETGALGRRDNSAYPPGYFKGRLDEVGFWNRILSDDEIADLCSGMEIITDINDEQHIASALHVYPSPSKDKIIIETLGTGTIVLMNMNGELVYSAVIESTTQLIDIASLSSGMYVIHYKVDGTVISKKIEKL